MSIFFEYKRIFIELFKIEYCIKNCQDKETIKRIIMCNIKNYGKLQFMEFYKWKIILISVSEITESPLKLKNNFFKF